MAIRDVLGSRRMEEWVDDGQAALDERRFEEAANHLKSALRIGVRSNDEEARIRCLLSVALEKRGLNPEQLEAVAKYEKPADFARLDEGSQMSVRIRLGLGYCFNNDIPRSIALCNQTLHLARPAGAQAQM